MSNLGRSEMEKHQLDVDYVLAVLRDVLPGIIQNLIASRSDMPVALKHEFITQFDNPAQHSPLWHQYGILTHSVKFQEIMADDIPKLISEWGLGHVVNKKLSEEIQAVSKKDLLRVVAQLHDVGKFTARVMETQEDGSSLARFHGHEADSGIIIRTEFRDTLEKLGMRTVHIEYIARCAEHHFDLGKARRFAIDNGGYTLTYAKSEEFKNVALDIINTNAELALEIGLMFIADSLSKTEIMAAAETDERIEAQRHRLEKEIKDKGLDPRLINQALQQLVNIEIGKQYLQVWADTQAE